MNFKEFLYEKTQDMVSPIAKNNKGKIAWDDPNPSPKSSGVITFKQAKDANKAYDELMSKGIKAGFDGTTKITFSLK